MTQNTFISAVNAVETPFCHSFSQIFHPTVFLATNSTGLSDLLSACGLVHSNRITNLFFVYFRGLAHCGCQLPHSLAHVACCSFLPVSIHICSPPQNRILFTFQLVCAVDLLINEGI